MPNLDFYAALEDHQPILESVLASGDFRIFEHTSRPDRSIHEFSGLPSIREHFGAETMHFQLFAVAGGGEPLFLRHELKPGALGNATFRSTCQGWGLIQLYLEAPFHGGLRASHSNHNSAKRAAAWAETYRDQLGEPEDWDFAKIESLSRKLNRFIRGLGVEKMGSRPILPWARRLREEGLRLQ